MPEKVISYEQLQGMDEGEDKGVPIKGRLYCVYTLIAMIVLIVIVGFNAQEGMQAAVADAAAAAAQAGMTEVPETTAEETTTEEI